MANRLLTSVLFICIAGGGVIAQGTNKVIYIVPTSDGFETYLSAAMHKKGVPVTVTTNQSTADYTLKASEVEVQKVGTGTKVLNCMFASCGGNEDKGSTSVQLIDAQGTVAWSYAVNKGRGAKNKQSLAEAVAKHFKGEFLHK